MLLRHISFNILFLKTVVLTLAIKNAIITSKIVLNCAFAKGEMLDWDLKKSTLYFQMKQPTVKKITWLPKRPKSIELLKLFRSKLYVLLKLKKKYILWKRPSFSCAFLVHFCRLTSVLREVLVLQKQTGLNLTEKESRRYVKKTICLIASASMASLKHTKDVPQNNPDYLVQGGVSQDQGR